MHVNGCSHPSLHLTHVRGRRSGGKTGTCAWDVPIQAWVDDMSRYIKFIDPNHLVMLGAWGYFGASTPELAEAQNPFDLTVHKLTDTVIFSADPVCQGEVALAHCVSSSSGLPETAAHSGRQWSS